jgi:hypothetical protein
MYRVFNKKRFWIILVALLMAPGISFATTPTISGVTGTISAGQTVTISGSNMVDSNTANWSYTESQGSFEGANYTADSWYADGSPTYATDIKLLGSKSMKSTITGAGASNCPSDNAFGGDLWRSGGRYNRAYFYFGSNFATHWQATQYAKMIEYTTPAAVYIQPNVGGSTVTSLMVIAGGSSENMNVPTAWSVEKWYCVEWYVEDNGVSVWVDGTSLGKKSGTVDFSQPYAEIGIINSCPVNGTFSMYVDGVASSTSRVYPASKIEVSDNATYGSGALVWQEPVSLGDTSTQVKVNLTGLGAGPYYLWVTNNKQERSATYNLSGVSPSVGSIVGTMANGVVWR